MNYVSVSVKLRDFQVAIPQIFIPFNRILRQAGNTLSIFWKPVTQRQEYGQIEYQTKA